MEMGKKKQTCSTLRLIARITRQSLNLNSRNSSEEKILLSTRDFCIQITFLSRVYVYMYIYVCLHEYICRICKNNDRWELCLLSLTRNIESTFSVICFFDRSIFSTWPLPRFFQRVSLFLRYWEFIGFWRLLNLRGIFDFSFRLALIAYVFEIQFQIVLACFFLHCRLPSKLCMHGDQQSLIIFKNL